MISQDIFFIMNKENQDYPIISKHVIFVKPCNINAKENNRLQKNIATFVP